MDYFTFDPLSFNKNKIKVIYKGLLYVSINHLLDPTLTYFTPFTTVILLFFSAL